MTAKTKKPSVRPVAAGGAQEAERQPPLGAAEERAVDVVDEGEVPLRLGEATLLLVMKTRTTTITWAREAVLARSAPYLPQGVAALLPPEAVQRPQPVGRLPSR